MALQTKVYSEVKNTFTLELTLVENSTSTAGNSSSVSYTLKLKSTTKDFYQYGVGAVVKLDGRTVATRNRDTAPKVNLPTRSEVTLLSGTTTVAHNSDGSKTMSLEYSLDMASASYTPGQMNGSGSMTLTKIPRGATITDAPDFTDEDNPVVKVSNPAGVAVQLGIYKTDGYGELAGYRVISGTTYTFNLTAAEREALRKVDVTKNTTQVRFYVKSVVGGRTFISSVTRTLTIRNPAPTLSPFVEDVNQATLELTGDASVMVRYQSKASAIIGAKAVKQATLASQSVTCGGRSLTGDGIIVGVESGTFTFAAKDSRGNTTTKTLTKKLVEYIPPTCNISPGLPDANGNFNFSVSGGAFTGSFGLVDNTLTVEARYRIQGDEVWEKWMPMEVSPGASKYTATLYITGLDYKQPYDFQAKVTDRLGSVESQILSIQAKPLWYYGKDRFVHTTPLFIEETLEDGSTIMHNVLGCGCTAHMGSNMTGVSTNVTAPMTVLDSAYGGMKLSNGAVYIPEDGLYLVAGQIMVASGANGRYLGLQVNGSKGGFILDSYIGFSKDYGVIASVPTLAKLQAGELVTLIARMSGATSGAMISGSSRTKLTIVKMY